MTGEEEEKENEEEEEEGRERGVHRRCCVCRQAVSAVLTAGLCSPVRGRMSGLRVPTLCVRGSAHARRCRGDRGALDRICDHASRVRGTAELSACANQMLAVAPWRCALAGNIFHPPLFSTSQHSNDGHGQLLPRSQHVFSEERRLREGEKTREE